MIVQLDQLAPAEKQNWLNTAIAPRPIALVSTVDREGRANLAPFSFFNLFSYDPPIVIFSPVRRIRDGSTKHTLDNLYDCREVVVHMVTFHMLHQMLLASGEYPKEVDEFEKAGFTKEAATQVRPPMIKECLVKMECRVNEIKPLGKKGGAGALAIAEVLCLHADDTVVQEKGNGIDQLKMQYIARLGEDWYTKMDESNLFRLRRPGRHTGIGLDALPESIRSSEVLTGNDLARLAAIESLPHKNGYENETLKRKLKGLTGEKRKREIHLRAKQLINWNAVDEAWQVLIHIE